MITTNKHSISRKNILNRKLSLLSRIFYRGCFRKALQYKDNSTDIDGFDCLEIGQLYTMNCGETEYDWASPFVECRFFGPKYKTLSSRCKVNKGRYLLRS